MLILHHEKFKFGSDHKQGKPIGCSQGSPGSKGRFKDSGSVAGIGGPAAGADNQSVRVKSHGFGTLYSYREPGGSAGAGAEATHRASDSFDAGCATATGKGLTEESSRVRTIPAGLGWANVSNSSERAFWNKGKGSPGREVDA